MNHFNSALKMLFGFALLAFTVSAGAQVLTGTWDLIEAPDGKGVVAGKMDLSSNGAINFNGEKSSWSQSGSRISSTFIGAAGVPASEVNLELNGDILQGTLVVFSYKLQGGSVVLTGKQSFPISARRPSGYMQEEPNRQARNEYADAQRTAQVQDRNDANARNQREADASKVQQERERQQNQARQQNLARQQEQVRQNADAAAAKQAAQQTEKLAAEQYLRAMQNGIRLGVKNCYGQYEVGGNKPDIKPEVVSCIDVHYRARCEGSAVNYDGVHKNFTGFDAGCFGDTATISPKPACPANQVHVEVVAVRACGG